MLNRFFVIEAQNKFLGLTCEGSPESCSVALTTTKLETLKKTEELEAYEHVLSSTACKECLECVNNKYDPANE